MHPGRCRAAAERRTEGVSEMQGTAQAGRFSRSVAEVRHRKILRILQRQTDTSAIRGRSNVPTWAFLSNVRVANGAEERPVRPILRMLEVPILSGHSSGNRDGADSG